MAGEALKEVFAVLGFKVDDKGLKKAEQGIKKTIGKTHDLDGAITALTFAPVSEGMRKHAKKVDASAKQLEDRMRRVKDVISAIAIGFVTSEIVRFIDGIRAVGDELDKTSQQVGLTTEELQAFQHAAGAAGVSGTDFTNSLGQLQQKAFEAANGSQESVRLFSQIGVEVKDANGELRSGSDLINLVADGLQGTSNSSERTALSMKLMGEQGRRLLPMLTEGAAGLAAMREDLEELGGGASPQMIQASSDLTDTLGRLSVAVMSLKSRLAVILLPAINWVTGKLIRLSVWFSAIAEKSHIVEVALGALGVVAVAVAIKFAIAWGVALAPVILVAAAVGILVLLIEDLIVAVEGGDSVTGDFIETYLQLIGVGGSLPEAWEGAIQMFTDLSNIITDAHVGILMLLQAVQQAPILNRIFGEGSNLQAILGDMNEQGRRIQGLTAETPDERRDRASRGEAQSRTVHNQEQARIAREKDRASPEGRARRVEAAAENRIQQMAWNPATGTVSPAGARAPVAAPTVVRPQPVAQNVEIHNHQTNTINAAQLNERQVGSLVEDRIQAANDRQTRQTEAQLVTATVTP